MNNLYRDLAPIAEEAWADIELEASRTFKRHIPHGLRGLPGRLDRGHPKCQLQPAADTARRIGYLSHDGNTVQLYLQETMTFLCYTAEASVCLGC